MIGEGSVGLGEKQLERATFPHEKQRIGMIMVDIAQNSSQAEGIQYYGRTSSSVNGHDCKCEWQVLDI